MMTPEARKATLTERLTATLRPTQLNITDDSAAHAGHPGAQSGAGHFTVHVASEAFVGKSLIEQHRLVYQAVGDLIPAEIHALRIDASLPA